MNHLSPELQQLFQAGELASRPTDADRARVFMELQARLGITANLGDTATNVGIPKSPSRTLVGKTIGITLASLAILAGSGALMLSLTRPMPRAVSSSEGLIADATPSVSTPAQTESPAAQQLSPPEPRTSADEQAKAMPTSAVARGTTRTRDSLREEVAILSRAQSALLSGHAESALRLLAEHERKYSHGILAEERTTAKIQALCALGRVSEANAMLGRLSPHSLTGESARQACSSRAR